MKKILDGAVIHCKYDELLDPDNLKDHPKNRNRHGPDQIARLAKLYKHHGIRHPIIVSRLTGLIVAGHGRKLAGIQAGVREFPVVYQDFEDLDAEYAFMQSDNAIAEWSVLDFGAINEDLQNLGPDFDLELLGIKNFTLDVAEKFDAKLEWEGMPEFDQEDKTSFRHVVVHFKSDEDAKRFFEKIEQPDTGKTRSIWYPPQEWMETETKRYG